MADRTAQAPTRPTICSEARRMRAIEGRMSIAKTLAVALVLVGAVDAASTEIALGTGMVFEANPLIRMLQGAIGFWWIAVKMGAHLLLALAVVWYPNRPTLIAMAVVTLATAIVAANNLVIYSNIVSQM